MIEVLTYLMVLKGEQAFPEFVSLIFWRSNSFISVLCAGKSFLMYPEGLCHLRIIMAYISSLLLVSSCSLAIFYPLAASISGCNCFAYSIFVKTASIEVVISIGLEGLNCILSIICSIYCFSLLGRTFNGSIYELEGLYSVEDSSVWFDLGKNCYSPCI